MLAATPTLIATRVLVVRQPRGLGSGCNSATHCENPMNDITTHHDPGCRTFRDGPTVVDEKVHHVAEH